jgi:hypothetical protein
MANAADEQRIRAVELQNTQLREQVDQLLQRMSSRPRSAPAPVVDDDPRTTRSAPIEMPSAGRVRAAPDHRRSRLRQ